MIELLLFILIIFRVIDFIYISKQRCIVFGFVSIYLTCIGMRRINNMDMNSPGNLFLLISLSFVCADGEELKAAEMVIMRGSGCSIAGEGRRTRFMCRLINLLDIWWTAGATRDESACPTELLLTMFTRAQTTGWNDGPLWRTSTIARILSLQEKQSTKKCRYSCRN